MSRATERLRERSTRYLLDARFLVNRPVGEDEGVNEEVGRILLAEINATLKLALQIGDTETFTELERRWQEIPEEGESWEETEDSPTQRLTRYQQVLSFGLAMWSAHLLREASDHEGSATELTASDALRMLAGRFEAVEDVFDIYEQAGERDDEDRVPWTSWFLEELPPEEAHIIPTSSELLFTALLLASAWTTEDQPHSLQPRDWMRWREEEVETALAQIAEEGPLWAPILGLSVSGSEQVVATDAECNDWRSRVSHLRDLIAEGRDRREEIQRRSLREAPLDIGKIMELEATVRKSILDRRLIRHLFAAQGGLVELPDRPSERSELASRHWLPKDLLVADSNVVGLETAARQLARAPLNGEVEGLLAVLPELDPVEVGDADAFSQILGRELDRMREDGFQPTLLLAPISWRLRQALGLAPIGSSPESVAGPLVPPAVAHHFAGTFEGVPILTAPQLPARQLWALDLPRVASFREWPSEEGSGVRLTVEAFSEAEARQLLVDKPEIVGDQEPDEVALWVQESALLTQYVCWCVEGGEDGAATAVQVPSPLAVEQTA
jgi:hypothetical protein